jgi:hypothetical protein
MVIQGVDNEVVKTLVQFLRNKKEGEAIVLDEMEPMLPKSVGRQDVIGAFKVLDGRFGDYIVGRSGYPTRFELKRSGDIIIDNIQSGYFAEEPEKEEKKTEVGKTTIPVPLRDGSVTAEINIPLDLTDNEAAKVASVIEAIGAR